MDIKFSLAALAGLTATIPGVVSCKNQAPVKPNIVYIMSDDHSFQTISAYGGPLASLAPTPNIDRIAAQGIRFDRCLVTNSISGPCRATVLTGKYSHLNGFLDNMSRFDSSQVTFPKILQAAGYNTAMIGKWHLVSEPTGFDFWEILPGQGDYYNPVFINASGQHKEHGYTTDIITGKTIEWLKGAKDSGKPFMVMMHHKAPHRAWDPGPDELGMFESVTFPEPATLFDDYSNRGLGERNQKMTIARDMTIERDLKLTNVPRRGLDSLQLLKWNEVYEPVLRQFNDLKPEGEELTKFKYQRYMKDYLSCISAVDKSVGRILDFLKENGLDKNTIVVYTSDQGFYMGEHGWFDKRWMFEESLRTPLLIQWPGVIKPGTVNSDLVSNLDYAETFLDIAGAEIPEEMQGRSFLSVLKGKTPKDWRKEHYYHYYEHPGEHAVPRHYGITTDRYKLMHLYYDIDEWELFDLENDPMEMRNVYNDPQYSQVKESLHRQLEELRVRYQDNDSLDKLFIRQYLENPRYKMMLEYMERMRQEQVMNPPSEAVRSPR